MSSHGGDAGGLIVSGGGSVVVASDELRRQAAELGELAGSLRHVRRLVEAVAESNPSWWLVGTDVPPSAQRAELATENAEALVVRCTAEAERVADVLQLAMYNYGLAEAVATKMLRVVEEQLGYTMGRLAPVVVLLAVPMLGTAAAITLLVGLVKGQSPAEVVRELGAWAREHASILTDPLTVLLFRGAMDSADDALGGLFQVSPAVRALIGDSGLGLTGIVSTAMAITALGQQAGLLIERPVMVSRSSTSATTPPASLAGRANRIPVPTDLQGEQVRIDRYSVEGEEDRFEVYIAGTVDFGVVASEEPWDMTSNINAVSGLTSASVDAVKDAMKQAGITSSSEVVLTGYSQGGLVATMLAASAEYDVKALVTFGAPAGFIELPPELMALAVRHADDIVPSVTGTDVSMDTLVVEREVYAGVDVPTDLVFPAHQLNNYQDTAQLIDESEDPRLREALAYLDTFAAGRGGGQVTTESTTYVAVRQDAG